ncbi:MAG TPA: transporter substrate-binding domain-containing protein, partial [Nevskiaceae bacterium]|nr:transporter substrate-binding domain-containing protein [Nevskiaceae bacterium]
MPGRRRDGRRAVWAALAAAALIVLVAAPARALQPELTADERAFLAEHPVIRLGIDSEFAPLEFVDEQGHYSGMVADYVALIGKRLSVRFEPQFNLNWRESYARGLRREIDVFASVGRTPERDQHFLFTAPYVDITSVIVMRNDHEGVVTADDLPEYRVALVEGYAESYHLLQRLPQLRVLFESSSQAALEAVSRGEADATIGSLPVLLYTMQKRALTNLKVVGANPTHSQKLHFMVRKDWPELQSILEKSLGAITPDEHRKIQEGWYSIRYEAGLDPRDVLIKVGGVGLIAFILLLALARWAVVSAREVRLRRDAEEQARATAGRLAESRALVEEANQRLQETTETIAGAVFQIRVRAGGGALDLEFLSGRLANALGLSPGGGTAVDFAALLKRVSEEDRDGFQASIADALRRGDTWQHEFRMEQPDGRVRWVRGESVPRRTPGGDFLASGYLSDVTERHAMEDALKRSETQLARALSRTSGQLQAILDNSPAAIWAKTLQGKYQFANEAFRRMFTIRREAVAGSTDEDFFPPRMVEAFRVNDRTVLKTRAAASFVEPLEREGSEQHILSVKFPLFDERGETVAIGGMSLDITEQVQLQEELRSLNRNLALREQQLLQISRSSAVDRGNLEDTFRLVTSAACAGLLVRRASVWFWNDAHDALECRHVYDVEQGSSSKPEVLARPDYPRYFGALDGGRSIVAHDVLAHPATLELLPGYLTPLGITSLLDTPIRHGGQVVGVLCCEHVGPTRRWRDEESFFAGALADAIGRAIVAGRERQADQALRTLNATLEERVEQRTRELREAMETLQAAQESLALKEAEAREAQAKLADITDSLPGAVYQFVRTAPRTYRFLFVSSGMRELVGVPREEFLKPVSTFGMLVLPEDRPRLGAAIEACKSGGFT